MAFPVSFRDRHCVSQAHRLQFIFSHTIFGVNFFVCEICGPFLPLEPGRNFETNATNPSSRRPNVLKITDCDSVREVSREQSATMMRFYFLAAALAIALRLSFAEAALPTILTLEDNIRFKKSPFTNSTNATPGECTTLCLAAKMGVYESLVALLRMGASVHATDEFGMTPLMYAMSGELELADSSAPKQGEEDGHTVNYTQCVSAILNTFSDAARRKAYVNVRDDEGMTALMYAAKFDNDNKLQTVERCALLLDAGADASAETKFAGKTFLYMLAERNMHATTTSLVIDFNLDSEYPRSLLDAPLSVAVGNEYDQLAVFLIQAGADVEYRNAGGQTPLQVAASKGNAQMARALMEFGANVNNNDEEGFTPLMNAVLAGSFGAVSVILSYDPELNKQTSKHRMTALHIAAELGYVDIVELLLEEAAQQTLENSAGLTAYQLAEQGGYFGKQVVVRMNRWNKMRGTIR